MIDDGDNVILSDDLRTRLYMTAGDYGSIDIASGQKDPTYGMTPAQRKRYEKRLRSKPRPRDIFDVESLVKKKEAKEEERKRQLSELHRTLNTSRSNKNEIVVRIKSDLSEIEEFKSIPNRVLPGPEEIEQLTSSRKGDNNSMRLL